MAWQQIDTVDLVSVATWIEADAFVFSQILLHWVCSLRALRSLKATILKFTLSASMAMRDSWPWRAISQCSSRSVEWNESGKRQTTSELNVAFDCSNLGNSNCARVRNKVVLNFVKNKNALIKGLVIKKKKKLQLFLHNTQGKKKVCWCLH